MENRLLSLSSVQYAKIKVKKNMEVSEKVKKVLKEEIVFSAYVNSAPFKWIGIVYHYVDRETEMDIEIKRIDKKDGECPVSAKLNAYELRDASFKSEEELYKMLYSATLKILIAVGIKFNLPTQHFEDLLKKAEV